MTGDNEQIGGLLSRMATNGTMIVQQLGKIVEALSTGNVGDVTESTILAASAIGLTTGTAANVTSISLTAGDWDVWGSIFFTPAATTSVTVEIGAISTTSATLPTAPGAGAYDRRVHTAVVPNQIFGMPVGRTRISLSATTTVYLVAQATFTVDTLAAYGYLGASLVR
jgi:hypothetical protein